MTKELVRSKEETENLSMEKILASIRGIINDDMMETNNQSSEKKEEKEAEKEDVLELTEILETTEKKEELTETPATTAEESKVSTEVVTSEEQKIASSNQEVMPEIVSTQAAETIKSEEIIEHKLPEKKHSGLISEEAANQASDAMKDLLSKTAKNHSDGLGFRSGTTVEDLVIETMKPYLTKWLDDNLPGIVKNLVQKEIQKLVPRE
jgi:cell pole-organizing protein PopZ